MDGKCGAFCAGERSEHALNSTRFSVHCSVSLGALLLEMLKLPCFDDVYRALIVAYRLTPISVPDF